MVPGAAKSISVSGKGMIEDDYVVPVFKALEGNVCVKMLSVYYWKIGDKGIRALERLLEVTTSLEDINISWHSHDGNESQMVQMLCRALRQNKTVKVLNIQYVELSLDSAREIADFLRGNNSLTELFVSVKQDDQVQAEALFADALQHNHTLLKLHMPMTTGSGATCWRYLERNQKKRKLDSL